MRLKHEIIKQKRRVNKTVTLIVELNFPKCISQSGDNMLLDETLARCDRPHRLFGKSPHRCCTVIGALAQDDCVMQWGAYCGERGGGG